MRKRFSSMVWACGLVFACIAISALPLQAETTKWVDQSEGNDVNDGDTEATAYATLQKAIDSSVTGTAATRSIINVKNGTYGITGQTNQGGFATAILISGLDYLTIHAVPGHSPEVKPSVRSMRSVLSGSKLASPPSRACKNTSALSGGKGSSRNWV